MDSTPRSLGMGGVSLETCGPASRLAGYYGKRLDSIADVVASILGLTGSALRHLECASGRLPRALGADQIPSRRFSVGSCGQPWGKIGEC